MTTYSVTATRHEEWWALHADVPGTSVWTQCRRLDQAEAVAREAISLALDEPADSFDVDVTSTIEDGLRARVAAARALSRLADRAQQAATLMNVQAARTLRDQGLSVRDTGALMSLSSQRISQLVPGAVETEEPGSADLANITLLVDEVGAEFEAATAALRASRRSPSPRKAGVGVERH